MDVYATIGDLVDRYGAEEVAQLGDPQIPRVVTGEMVLAAAAGEDLSVYTEEEQAAVSDAMGRLSCAIQDATTIIDGYLRSRYVVPVQQVPATLVRWCCDLARYFLFDNGAPEHVSGRHKATMELLRSVGRGEMDLGLTPSGPAATNGGAVGVKTRADRTYSHRTLEAF